MKPKVLLPLTLALLVLAAVVVGSPQTDTAVASPPSWALSKKPHPTKSPSSTPTTTVSTTVSTTVEPTTVPTTTAVPTTPPPSSTCTDPQWVITGNDYVNTNNTIPYLFVANGLWNPPSGSYSQTTYACSERSWYVEAQLPFDNYTVWSYPNSHADFPGDACYSCGAPMPAVLRSTFAGFETGGGAYNVSWDLWLNGVGNGNGSTEVMVWTETSPQDLQPLWSPEFPVGTIVINGVTFDAYHWTDGDANVVSYKAQATVQSGDYDLRAIIFDAVNRGWTTPDPLLGAIAYGVELRGGAPTQRFDLTEFTVTTG